MNTNSRRFTVAASLAALGILGAWPAGVQLAQAAAPTAATLVEQALEAELTGADRATLLQKAIDLQPNYAPARWQLGQVQVYGKWLTPEEVPSHAKADANYAAYLKKRETLVDTAEEHRQMARWCQPRRLEAEARLHWGKVLGYEREDAEALTALGLERYDGRLLTRSQIEDSKRDARERKQAMRVWRPRMLKWRQAIDGQDEVKRAVARGDLSRIDDPAALAALESVFYIDQVSERADRANLALISVAERMPHPEATAMLLREAMGSQSPAVVGAATTALKKRPMHTYVPQLISALPNAVKTQYRVLTMPNGTVAHEHAVEVTNASGAKQVFTYEAVVHPTDFAIAQRVTPIAVATELNKAAQVEAAAATTESRNRQVRERIETVLKETTGFEDVTDPDLLNQQFADYYGWSKPEKSTTVVHQHAQELAAFFPIPPSSNTNQRPEGGLPLPNAGATGQPQGSGEPGLQMRGFGNLMGMMQVGGECFAAGTPVMTVNGPRPIESLKAGDRVLAQDVKSGALEFKTVQDRTLRLGAKVVKLKIGAETLTATYGHPFWVVGTGWKVAGHLHAGERLRGLEQDFVVDAIEESRPTEVYNLLVSDHATYFVGEQRLLVHDDSQVLETGHAVPGLLAKAK